jgi:hypothetical protein
MARLEFELDKLKTDEVIRAIAGVGEETFTYDFKVIEPGEKPLCELKQTDTRGNIVGPVNAILEGSGRWTTPKQNPVQNGDWLFGRPQQDKAMNIFWGHIYTGGFLVISNPDETVYDRVVLQPECSEILLNPDQISDVQH